MEYVLEYIILFSALSVSLSNVETSQCFVQSHVLLTRWIAQVFLPKLRNKCMFSSALAWKSLCPRIFLSVYHDVTSTRDDFTLLSPQGYVVDFFIEFLQCSFILKLNHNAAIDHINA
jgi:hypothetical protein